MKKHNPPKCPECKKPLTIVYENVYETYEFNKKYGSYNEIGFGSMEIRCPNCNTDLSDIFEQGVCNF